MRVVGEGWDGFPSRAGSCSSHALGLLPSVGLLEELSGHPWPAPALAWLPSLNVLAGVASSLWAWRGLWDSAVPSLALCPLCGAGSPSFPTQSACAQAQRGCSSAFVQSGK